jgi:CRP/FNR family transcriptional regulator, anaerobic regulatory protein
MDESMARIFQGAMYSRNLPKGTVIVAEGQLMEEMHFIETGLVRAFYYKDNRDITSWMATEGRFIWPLPSHLLHRPSNENIQLLESATILSISHQDLDKLKSQYSVFNELKHKVMERYIVLYDIRVQLLLIPKAEERIEAYNHCFPDLCRRAPLRHIATFLGIDPCTLSRIRATRKNNLVRKGKT